MKFKCGLTEEEKSARYVRLKALAYELVTNGELRFAWLPVKIKDGDCRWLEKVRRYPVKVAKYTGSYASSSIVHHTMINYLSRSAGIVTEWRYEAIN